MSSLRIIDSLSGTNRSSKAALPGLHANVATLNSLSLRAKASCKPTYLNASLDRVITEFEKLHSSSTDWESELDEFLQGVKVRVIHVQKNGKPIIQPIVGLVKRESERGYHTAKSWTFELDGKTTTVAEYFKSCT